MATVTEFRESINYRKNLINFLHIKYIKQLNELFGKYFNVEKKYFYDIAEKAIELKLKKLISKELFNEIVDILLYTNTDFKVEHYRYVGNSIYEYDCDTNRYIFLKKSSKSDYSVLLSENGKYV